MPSLPAELSIYRSEIGDIPFVEWLRDLPDARLRGRIMQRLIRLRTGNPGDCRALGGGLAELRIHLGPGYRVYFARQANGYLVLTGGSKRTQTEDIKEARTWLQDARRRQVE